MKETIENHRNLEKSLIDLLGNYMYPFHFGVKHNLTYNDCLSINRRLILSYRHAPIENGNALFWPPIKVIYSNLSNADLHFYQRFVIENLHNWKNELSIVSASFPPEIGTYIQELFAIKRKEGIRHKSHNVHPHMEKWFEEEALWNLSNIVMIDFFTSIDLVELSIQINYRKSECLKF
ncbi:unnamed protein product [Lepeophtheirus salmonis]|uniref:(salmon louse) hypothetical protein n=3 Tax=Lepeophtheirus salmonis TaxID=72036 RepID=A0A7R8H087_LEPSM|nr:unnamed protein product [Lepeophtheirus salmonis]CAF2781287.1 unnamed protein product [Lepeophtheirus salmonis]